jgi:curved DNA-binding protein CbpA
MEQRDFEEINRFLATVGKATLFEYLGIATEATSDEAEAAIRQRRAWAQGQQNNPKYRQEALWVIKSVTLCRRALIEERAQYQAEVEGRDRDRKLQVLRLFVLGTLADGVLTPKGEEAIREQGAKLGLDVETVDAQVAELLSESHAARSPGPEDPGPPGRPSFIDHYAVLGVPAHSSVEVLEQAHRDRYHWARQLQDTRRAGEIYGRLDQAWDILKDPITRARYDEKRREVLGTSIVPPAAPKKEPEPLRVRRLALAGEDTEDVSDAPTTHSTAGGHSRGSPPPRVPDALTNPSRTLNLGGTAQPARPERAARLHVDGPEVISIKARKAPVQLRLTIRNGGSGRMPGRVFVDRDWVEVNPSRLDPGAAEQIIQVTIDPRKMPRNKAVALVTVATDDQERKAITIEAERPNPLPWLIGLAALMIVGVSAFVASRIEWGDPPVVDPPHGILNVICDPPAGEVTVAGTFATSEGVLREHRVPPGQPVAIKVELDGFEPFTREVTIEDGATETVEPVLKLTDPMGFTPTAEQTPAPFDDEGARALVQRRADRLDACFAQHLTAEPGSVASTELTAYVSPRGYVMGVNFEKATLLGGEVQRCIKRELRAIKFSLVQGDYATFRTSLRYVVREPKKG